MKFSTLVRFSKLVSDSSTSERIFSLLTETVVRKCGAVHAFVFGATLSGDFTRLSSYGACDPDKLRLLDLDGVCSIEKRRTVVMNVCKPAGYESRAFPLISDTGLFGALVVLYPEINDFRYELSNQPPDF